MKKEAKEYFFCKKPGEIWGSKKKHQGINVSKLSYAYLKDKEKFGWKPKTADNC